MIRVTLFLVFTAAWFLPALAVFPVVQQIFNSITPNSKHQNAVASGLAPGIGVGIFLVLFSLFGRIFSSYTATSIASLTSMFLIGGILFLKQKNSFEKSVSLLFPLLALLILHCAFWTVRTGFSDIHFDPNQYGAEKLFNLSLQQSFTYGTSYPPESLWLAGEPESYYILPRILPGFLTHIFTHFSSLNVGLAGIFFHLSDTFYNALAIVTLGTAVYALMSSQNAANGKLLGIASLAGLFPFLAAPARVFAQIAVGGEIDFWSLSRIIPYTINEYPFWNFLFADNHAHNNAAFLDILVTFLTLTILWKSTTLTKHAQRTYGCVLGFVATALLMSQTGSVLIACVTLSIPLLATIRMLCANNSTQPLMRVLSYASATALITSAPTLLSQNRQQIFWHVVPPHLASRFSDFLSVHFSFLVGFGIFATLIASKAKKPFSTLHKFFIALLCVVGGLSWFLGYEAVTFVSAACAVCAAATLRYSKDNATLSLSVITGFSLVAVFPEVIAANFNMGPNYIRFNTSFKFLYTSFFILPLALTFIYALEQHKTPGRFYKFVATSLTICAICAFGWAQYKTWQQRLKVPGSVGGISGVEFFALEHATDNSIVNFLRTIKGRVVLAEECGMPPLAASYSMAGRISAYSGRPALCGWGMHSFLHHNTFHAASRTGKPVWNHLTEVRKNLSLIYEQCSEKNQTFVAANVRNAAQFLISEGGTHLILGELELAQHPNVNIRALARCIEGTTVFENGGTGIVALPVSKLSSPEARDFSP